MGFESGLSEFGVPVFLIGAAVVIGLATLALHFLFPPASGKCPMKKYPPSTTQDEEKEKAR